MKMPANYYELLGVSRTANTPEIRERFRLLARERHPDRFQGSEKAEAEKGFQLLTEAVNVLTNPQRRKSHDFELDKGGGRETASDPTAVAKTYVSIGVKAFKAGDFRGAAENFDMAVKHNPHDSKAWHFLATAYAKNPKWIRQAIAAIEKAIELEPMNAGYFKESAVYYKQVGLTAKAERAYESVLKWNPDDLDVQMALSELRGTKKGESAGKGILGGLFRKSEV